MRMVRAYDSDSAKQLLPLLGSITSEMRERIRTLHRLEGLEVALRASKAPQERAHSETELANLQAELSTQRQALRHAEEELSALGCSASEDDDLTVLIPGEHGELSEGFAWRPGDSELRCLSAGSAA